MSIELSSEEAYYVMDESQRLFADDREWRTALWIFAIICSFVIGALGPLSTSRQPQALDEVNGLVPNGVFRELVLIRFDCVS